MKNSIFYLLLVMIVGCNDQIPASREFPIIKTLPPINNNESGVTFRAEVIQHGNSGTISYGFVWNYSDDIEEPQLGMSNEITLGENIGERVFSVRINHSIKKGLTYRVRAFAIMSDRTVYGNVVSLRGEGEEGSWSFEVGNIPLNKGTDPHNGNSNWGYGYVMTRTAHLNTYNPAQKSFTSATDPLVSPDSNPYFKSVAVGNVIYYFCSANSLLYKLQKSGLSTIGVKPFSISGVTPFCMGHGYAGRMYVFQNSATYEFIDIDFNNWTTKSPMPPTNGFAMMSASIGSKVYILTSENVIWEYDITNDDWIVKTNYPGLVGENMVSFSYGDVIYMGLNADDKSKEFWAYNIVSDSWVLQQQFPGPKKIHFYFPLANKLYMGTTWNNGYAIWTFDPSIE